MSQPMLPPDMEAPKKAIVFQSEAINFELDNPSLITSWIEAVVRQEEKTIQYLSFIFCSDPYLHQINMEYLQHDTYTDIITFPYGKANNIEGDIFISIDRIRENASAFEIPFEEELYRVIIHGVLHLCGYKDKSSKEKAEMTAKEDSALGLLRKIILK